MGCGGARTKPDVERAILHASHTPRGEASIPLDIPRETADLKSRAARKRVFTQRLVNVAMGSNSVDIAEHGVSQQPSISV